MRADCRTCAWTRDTNAFLELNAHIDEFPDHRILLSQRPQCWLCDELCDERVGTRFVDAFGTKFGWLGANCMNRLLKEHHMLGGVTIGEPLWL